MKEINDTVRSDDGKSEKETAGCADPYTVIGEGEGLPERMRQMEEILSGRRSEVEYLWKHPELGVITVRCGGMLGGNSPERQVLQGYHQDVTEIRTLQKPADIEFLVRRLRSYIPA